MSPTTILSWLPLLIGLPCCRYGQTVTVDVIGEATATGVPYVSI